MRWDELTGDLFPAAVQKAEGVWLLPLSCLERHGHHLPLATDMFLGREVCHRAAALEPAIVFPDFIFTQILEARHYPGCIGIEPDLTIRLLDGHAGEKGTSAILAIRPDLVHRRAIPTDGEGMPLGRLQGLRDLNIDVGVWWYADYPTHYCGDGIPASSEKGNFWLDARARGLARSIRAIKDDTETKRLQDEFFGRAGQH